MSTELELRVYRMHYVDADGTLLAEHPDGGENTASYDVELRFVDKESGDVEVIHELKELEADETIQERAKLQSLYPNAVFYFFP